MQNQGRETPILGLVRLQVNLWELNQHLWVTVSEKKRSPDYETNRSCLSLSLAERLARLCGILESEKRMALYGSACLVVTATVVVVPQTPEY